MRVESELLCAKWIAQGGFTSGMMITIRWMPDCVVITAWNSCELYGCAEGRSVAYVNKKSGSGRFRGPNDTGDPPVYRCEN